jgi:Mn2+/Fe2+ NRAMP family transporter
MITMMHMTENRTIMGKYPVHDGLRLVGWIATAIMTVAAGAMMIAALV